MLRRRFKRASAAEPVEDAATASAAGEAPSGEGDGWAALPDLVIVDGGKGQLSAAHDVMRDLAVGHLPLAGLAKRNEELFLVDEAEPIVLPRTSQALYLVQRVRDEAHRFAITYHRKVRAEGGHAVGAGRGAGHRAEAEAGAAAQVRLGEGHPRGRAGRHRRHRRLHAPPRREGEGVPLGQHSAGP